jgi:hypothetical protein
MHSKFDIQFDGTLDEFNAWTARIFKDHGSLRVKVQVLSIGPTISDPLVHTVAETFRREITVEDANEIRKLIEAGNRIGAIKTFRGATGLGLAESKNFLDTQIPPK